MDQTHIHLVITHLPIFGSILSAGILAYGLWSKSDQTKIAAYLLLILSALGAGVAYLTGEGAEETVENIQGISESIIEAHEEFAITALIAFIISGISAIVGIITTARKSSLTRLIAIIVFWISLVCFGIAARTGYLGGQIRHTEIRSGNTQATENGQNQGEENNSND